MESAALQLESSNPQKPSPPIEPEPAQVLVGMRPQPSEELRQALARISDRWSYQVINQLACQSMRFGELRRAVEGISSRMLTETVRKLERDGIISRRIGIEKPPTVCYSVTAPGFALLESLTELDQWAKRHQGMIEESRRHYDANPPSMKTHRRPVRGE